jgi:CheY-like chemotaxis protein
MLENEGNQVSLATNGQEACEAYEAAVERGEPFEVTRSRSRSPNPEPRTPNPEAEAEAEPWP